MPNMISLPAQPRDKTMTPKALRRANYVPGIMYGPGSEPEPLQFDKITLLRVLRQAGTSALIELSIQNDDEESEPDIVFVRDIQRDPVTDDVIHVDLYRTQAGRPIRLAVPLVQEGSAPVTEDGAVVNTLLTELEIECLPQDMPDAIRVDISSLVDLDSTITVGDLTIPEGVTALVPPDTDVVRPVLPTMEIPEEEEEVVELGEEELVEGAEEVLEEGELPEEGAPPDGDEED